MRTLAMLVGAAALSWAHVAIAQEAQQQKEEMKGQQQQGSQETMQPSQGMQEQGAKAEHKMGREARAEKRSLFEGKSNFDLEGKISKVGRDTITLSREDLPAATLKVSKETKIEVDGNTASIKELKQGQDVKASFNLQGEKPLAVEIKAQKAESPTQTQ